MKTVKTVVFVIVCVLGCVVVACAQQRPEARLSVDGFVPDDDDTWDVGIGVEAQYVTWLTHEIGIAVAAGVSQWAVEEESIVEYDPEYDVTVGIAIDGDATLLPVGVSCLYRPSLEGISLTIEAGVRYVVVDSNVDIEFVAMDERDVLTGESEVEIDDGIVGRVAADLAVPLSDQVSLFGGIGYQFDISEGDVEWMGESLGDNELAAFYGRAGVVITL